MFDKDVVQMRSFCVDRAFAITGLRDPNKVLSFAEQIEAWLTRNDVAPADVQPVECHPEPVADVAEAAPEQPVTEE